MTTTGGRSSRVRALAIIALLSLIGVASVSSPATAQEGSPTPDAPVAVSPEVVRAAPAAKTRSSAKASAAAADKSARNAAGKAWGGSYGVSKNYGLRLVQAPGKSWLVDVASASSRTFSSGTATARGATTEQAKRALKAYKNAARSKLKSLGFSAGSSKASGVWVYTAKTVSRTVAEQDFGAGIAISCASRKAASKVTVKVNSFAKAYRAVTPKSTRDNTVVSAPHSYGKGVKGYSNATGSINDATGIGGAAGLYYKAPKGSWIFLTATQAMPDCSTFEKRVGASRAFAGSACWRSSGSSGYESTVVAR